MNRITRLRRISIQLAVAGLILASPRAQTTANQAVPIGLDELFKLCRPQENSKIDKRVIYQCLGILKRTDELDAQNRFVLVHPLAACCARGVAVGMSVHSDSVTQLKSGTRVMVRGRIQAVNPALHLPRGHMAQHGLGVLRRHLEIELVSIEAYNRLKDKKLVDLTDRLSRPAYKTFARALRATGWDKALRQPSYFTVLAPTEHAFGQLTIAEQRALFLPENAARLEALVKRHIVVGWKTKQDLMELSQLETLGEGAVLVKLINGRLWIGGARLLFQDSSARNGVVLSLGSILPKASLPPKLPDTKK